MAKQYETGKSGIDIAKELADWIISRKIFSDSTDRIAVVAFGTKLAVNELELDSVQVHDSTLQRANFDQLRFINNELSINHNSAKFAANGLIVALQMLRDHAASEEDLVDEMSIVVISNDCTLGDKDFKTMKATFNELSVGLITIGSETSTCNNTIADLAESLEGQIFSFENMIGCLSHFATKEKDSRASYKSWEIAPGIRLPLAFTTKSVKTNSGLKFSLANEFGSNVMRVNQLRVENEEGEVQKFTQLPKAAGADYQVKQLSKDDTCYGYYFGTSLIFVDDNELKEQYNNHNFNEGEKGGCLKLIQFTKRANIHPSYFIGDKSYTVIPAVSKPLNLNFTRCTIAMIQAMLELDVVAICRYAYNASTHLQLMALIPHRDDETETYFLRALRLPFADDMKCMKFGNLDEDEASRPTVAQLAAIDDLIDVMQLDGQEAENFEAGGVLDPAFQMECICVKNKALNPNETDFSQVFNASSIIQKCLAPNKNILESRHDLFERLAREFNLQTVEKISRKRIALEPKDLEELLNDVKTKIAMTPQEKKKAKVSRWDELKNEFEEDPDKAAKKACEQSLITIRGMCSLPDNSTRNNFFKVLVGEMRSIQEMCFEFHMSKHFNDYLEEIKRSADYEDFVDFMQEDKSIFPIHSQEEPNSNYSRDEALDFWD
ncbi:unnamed protein product [Caenorhabditis bovis]|uniref:Ku domain-containing protein n=1 Tax=Caenorhabditis bovis TaxID=2654633 RepID=A0A8S1EQL7_9PELO|nr:unnamed protein product [Caenorhabditis bovis]